MHLGSVVECLEKTQGERTDFYRLAFRIMGVIGDVFSLLVLTKRVNGNFAAFVVNPQQLIDLDDIHLE